MPNTANAIHIMQRFSCNQNRIWIDLNVNFSAMPIKSRTEVLLFHSFTV